MRDYMRYFADERLQRLFRRTILFGIFAIVILAALMFVDDAWWHPPVKAGGAGDAVASHVKGWGEQVFDLALGLAVVTVVALLWYNIHRIRGIVRDAKKDAEQPTADGPSRQSPGEEE